MIYEVTAKLLFINEDEATDFYHDCELALAKSTCINPLSENQEYGIIQVMENHHDENPNEPCSLLQEANNAPVPP